MDPLDDAILRSRTVAFAAYGSSEIADMRYLTRFSTTDPVVYVRKAGEQGVIVVSQMECERAARESTAAAMSRAQAGLLDILKEEKDRWKAHARMVAGLAGGPVLVPPHIPYALGRELAALVRVEVDRGALEGMRAVKSGWEVEQIRAVQSATGKAMEHALALITRTRARKGVLYLGAVPLTSERVRSAMHRVLLDHGCTAAETIVACAEETAVPHVTGSGPLHEDQPIVIDVFPRDQRSGYYSDMTRTVCRGEPSPEVSEMFDAVLEAQVLAASRIRPGVSGADVHQEVVDLFTSKGYESGSRGFIHNLGHGVGLEVHESPSLGPGGGLLSAGNVVTNEPGLYYPGTGGVRLENIGLIRDSGFETFSGVPPALVL
jgi:Xaa-Pro aminopeptidase